MFSPRSAQPAETLDDATTIAALRLVWSGDVRGAEAVLKDAPAESPRSALLRGMAAFLVAAISGDKAAAGRAVAALRECARVCKLAEAPDTWRGWASSWVVHRGPSTIPGVRTYCCSARPA